MAVQPVTIMVGGQKVMGNLYLAEANMKNRGVLFLHGWTGKPNTHAAETLMQQGYAALTIAFRGHAPSEGDIKTVTSNDSIEDALAAYDFLAGILGPDAPIIVAGNSYGSYIAVLLSAQRKVQALSLRVPANYPDGEENTPKWGRGHEDPEIDKWRHQPMDYTANSVLKIIHDFTGPVQIVEAEADEIIPHQTVQNYADALTDKTKLTHNLMKGWPHSIAGDPTRSAEFQQVLLAWLKTF